ncbi:hypothetical protein KEM60_02445 [Austwickia sp. TVS 96-490-7B]|uniref:maleylpyruvate isomerase N-terminal domain-containing protein n=1 Tax=Austwickia sp. TVS 96-490-7B TaxID=2830843 RepID=UPI001C581F51|nr:maleylpyruvate isomerase N-terminal domain-containing protein [Austwickia sp. TVS 96-490-7B]MBW3086234.1 hypothetical protein [Austwickia sp. TVS 96-490-7B]
MTDAEVTSTLQADLELLEVETASFLESVGRLTPEELSQRCGMRSWSRAQTISWLSRHAEGLVRLVVSARTGVSIPQYVSSSIRDEEVLVGAADVTSVVAASRTSADVLRDALGALALPLISTETFVDGMNSPVASLPRLRLREVLRCHADVECDWTPAQAHPLAVADVLDLAVERLSVRDDVPGMTLSSIEGDRYVVGDGSLQISGCAAALMDWLCRGCADEVTCAGPLPASPWL